MIEQAIGLVLLDLDGVIRHFDQDRVPAIEASHGLAEGVLLAAAFEHPRGRAVITGSLSRTAWIEQVGAAVGSLDAAHDWLDHWGEIDPVMRGLLQEIRSAGTQVALLTNGTDTIGDELEHHRMTEAFDQVFCSAFIGVAKPEPRAFMHVCQATSLEPAQIYFTDDTAANVAAAATLGFAARDFVSPDMLRMDLIARSVLS